jgi:GST-like protein
MPLTLYGEPGWGSAIVEPQLGWLGLDYRFERVGDLIRSAASRAALEPLNPLAQVPTLVLEDGRVMTESAAITLFLADRTGSDDLVPGAEAAERAEFLRWLVFFVANIYPTFTYGDDPSRFVPDPAGRDGFRQSVDAWRKRLYGIAEAAAGSPWFLGERFSALDIYSAVLTRWEPGPDWFRTEAPKLAASGAAARSLPALAAIARRNFPGA